MWRVTRRRSRTPPRQVDGDGDFLAMSLSDGSRRSRRRRRRQQPVRPRFAHAHHARPQLLLDCGRVAEEISIQFSRARSYTTRETLRPRDGRPARLRRPFTEAAAATTGRGPVYFYRRKLFTFFFFSPDRR